jgi:hypothetical protein
MIGLATPAILRFPHQKATKYGPPQIIMKVGIGMMSEIYTVTDTGTVW